MHYDRWYTHGDIGDAAPIRIKDRICSVEGCSRGHLARGYCSMHLQRVLNSGEPGDAVPRRRCGDSVGYMTAHEHHRPLFAGDPCTHADDTCKGPLVIAFNHDTPVEFTLIETQGDHAGYRYSNRSEDYFVLCLSHHMRYDNAEVRNRGERRTRHSRSSERGTGAARRGSHTQTLGSAAPSAGARTHAPARPPA